MLTEGRVSADVFLQDAAPASSAISTDYNEGTDTCPKGLLSVPSNNPHEMSSSAPA